MRIYSLLGILLAAMLLNSRCTTQTDFTVHSDGSGKVSLRIELSSVLVGYYSDLATGFLPDFDPKHPRIFDLDALRIHVAQEKHLTLTSALTPTPERLLATFSFQNLETLFFDPKLDAAISLGKKNGEETIRIRINQDTLKTILAWAPNAQSNLFRMLLPPENKPIHESDYRKQLVWALEEYAPEEELHATFNKSRIAVRIHTPGPILRQKGGFLEGPSTVLFSLPLLTLLTTPTEFELTYQR